MNAALIYRARSRWLSWVAFVCAVAIHLTAIAIAGNKSKPVVVDVIPDSFGPPVVEIDDTPPPRPEEEQTILPSVTDENEFTEENVARTPIHPRQKIPVAPVVRSVGAGRPAQSGSVKALALYAPRPSYPYEARRSSVTGSGVAELTVNSESGNVIEARMSQSTGSSILDNATVATLRRWRFKPGIASNIAVPITYTLTGVSY
jgi:periplasmic protein TonB